MPTVPDAAAILEGLDRLDRLEMRLRVRADKVAQRCQTHPVAPNRLQPAALQLLRMGSVEGNRLARETTLPVGTMPVAVAVVAEMRTPCG